MARKSHSCLEAGLGFTKEQEKSLMALRCLGLCQQGIVTSFFQE